ncbi:Chromodomain-helicase-DNA-binding protein 5 [Phytophthora citrophthora]|uniref:Chromodomain-helicase-DNA-binding protein 5 n=1 Tax=Phytophthora citrophthora TaxID=4793 RepID=A0AAD9GY75_9STRA|nr:Chromodomain-helicase-DNA-binding protein 5 [Phytophthora citrophthora]
MYRQENQLGVSSIGKMASTPEDAAIRAEIPALLSVADQERNREQFQPQYRQRWGWRDGQRPKISKDEITEFVQTYSWQEETEMALQSLFEGDYDVPKAVEIIHDTRREKLSVKREEAERIDKNIFQRAMDRHGKKFHLVKRRFRNVSSRELVNKFYLWKDTLEYKKWHDSQREKKRKREAKRIARQRPAADHHMEFCAICLKGGKLLCCDGCVRAYHLNCVRPALLDIPDGDWFCSHCRFVTFKAPPPPKREVVSAPGPSISKPTSKPKTRPNGSSLKGRSVVQPASHVHDVNKMESETQAIDEVPSNSFPDPFSPNDVEQRSEVENHAAKTDNSPDKCEPKTSENEFNHRSSDEFSSNDAISDITTESESDGGTAKIFQSLSSKYVVTTPPRKRKHRCSKMDTTASKSRYSTPSRSLEYLSGPLPANMRNSCGEVMPLQLESASSARKRKRRSDIQRNTSHSYATDK